MSDRPPLALLDNTLTPYRLHFHRRIAAELPLRPLSLVLHDRDHFPWTLDKDGIEPISFAGREPALVKAGRILQRLRRVGALAVVVGGYACAVRAAVIAGARRAGIPCLLFGDSNARGPEPAGLKHLAKQAALPRLLRRCDAVLACGRLGREYFRRWGVPDERIFLSPYEPDYRRVLELSEARRAELAGDLRPDRKRVVFSGRLVPEKRVDLLVRAFLRLAPRRPEWDLVIAGDGPLRAAIEREAAPLGERARFLGFVDDAERLAAIYRSSHLLAVPSDVEPWAVVVNEGLAAGMALVCSDAVGAAADLLRDGVNGRSFPASDLDRLSEALEDATAAERLERYRQAGREVLAEWRRVADPVAGLRAALVSVGVRCAE